MKTQNLLHTPQTRGNFRYIHTLTILPTFLNKSEKNKRCLYTWMKRVSITFSSKNTYGANIFRVISMNLQGHQIAAKRNQIDFKVIFLCSTFILIKRW